MVTVQAVLACPMGKEPQFLFWSLIFLILRVTFHSLRAEQFMKNCPIKIDLGLVFGIFFFF